MPLNTAYIDRVLELTNRYRSQNGRAPLRLNPELTISAQNHSQDMALRDYFSHDSPINGSTPYSRARAVGYVAMSMGENIGRSYTTPDQVVQGWINSPEHRANILNPNYKEMGIGYYYLANDTGRVNYNYYWTQVFGSTDTNTATNLPQPRLDFGNLPKTPTLLSGNLDTNHTSDVYKFSIANNDTRSINLSLHNISTGDDADISLYKDLNGNGTFDSSDQFLRRSRNTSNVDDHINYKATAGNYLAVVERYASSQGRVDYALDLSATPSRPYPGDDPTQAPNLLPREIEIGNLFSNSAVRTFNETVGDADTVDTYAFSLPNLPGGAHLVRINLGVVAADADLRLIQDSNGNRVVDQGEVVDSSINSGTNPESIAILLSGGDYFVQVYQYSGDTLYQLTFPQDNFDGYSSTSL